MIRHHSPTASSSSGNAASHAKVLDCYGFDRRRPFLDQLDGMTKDVLYRASYEIARIDFPALATDFAQLANVESKPATRCGDALQRCIKRYETKVATMTADAFAELFVSEFIAPLARTTDRTHVRFVLLMDEVHDDGLYARYLRIARCLWQLHADRPTEASSLPPAIERLDKQSVWAWWNRKMSHPIHIQEHEAETSIADGFTYDLREMRGFDAPHEGEVRITTRDLLREGAMLRSATVPDRAFVEINFPPFVALCFVEMAPNFVIVEALDKTGKALPIYLFPNALEWQVPSVGFGPGGRMETFDQAASVLAMMASAALRDFWVVEEREYRTGPPRIKRIAGMKNKSRRVVYLPRLAYRGSRGLRNKLERATDMAMRAAHWRSDHYRKLPEGAKPTLAQLAIAAAHRKSPPDGYTWVRGSSVAGEDVERVYRSRSVSQALFDVLPSKGKTVPDLHWYAFEKFCGAWLRSNGFKEVCKTAVDRGIDITAIKARGGKSELWAVQSKHWTHKVGPAVVRELHGAMVQGNADRAILITSSAFTPDAIRTASALKIDLVDGDRLKECRS